MKLKSAFILGLYALALAAPIGVAAADAEANASKTTGQKAVTPHSHLTEKTGIVPKPAEAAPDKTKAKADKDKTKHFHPRDGK